MRITEVTEWAENTWPEPPRLSRVEMAPHVHVCPLVGVPLPGWITTSVPFDVFQDYFEGFWYDIDPLMWDIIPYRRDEWFDEICDGWKKWIRRIRFDSTPRFYKNLTQLRKKGGGVIVVSAAKGEGKSIIAQMVGTRLYPDIIPNVIWEHADLSGQVTDEDDLKVTIIIDEDLLSTGENSGNIIIHIDNVWQTIRKTNLFIVSTGVKAKGNPSVDIWLRPCGINEKYQATRCAVMTSKGNFIGWAVFQRKHRPEDLVRYYSELDTWATYESRAKAYSMEVLQAGGVREATTPEEEERHIGLVKDWLEENVDRDLREDPPVMDRMLTYAKRLGVPSKSSAYLKRMVRTALGEWEDANPAPPEPDRDPLDLEFYEKEFRKWLKQQDWAKMPPQSVLQLKFYKLFPDLDDRITGSMVSGIIGTIMWEKELEKIEAREQAIDRMEPEQILEDGIWATYWKEYARAVLSNYPGEYKLASRDAQIVTYRQMGLEFKQIKSLLELNIRTNSIQERFYHSQNELKVFPNPTQLGTAGERFLRSRIDSAPGPEVGVEVQGGEAGSSARAGVPDLQVGTIAVNVKVDMSGEVDFDRTIETSPEHEAAKRCVVFLFPLLGRVGIAGIRGENTRYNSADLEPVDEAELVSRVRAIVADRTGSAGGVLCGIEAAVDALLGVARDE